jgi:hypothetical protein
MLGSGDSGDVDPQLPPWVMPPDQPDWAEDLYDAFKGLIDQVDMESGPIMRPEDD